MKPPSVTSMPKILFKESTAFRNAVFTILDSIFAFTVLSFCLVAHWRGTWVLVDLYVYPDDELKTGIFSAIVGVGGHAVFIFGQHTFARYFSPHKSKTTFYVISRLYTITYAFVSINWWRGPWTLLSIVFPTTEMKPTLIMFAIGIVGLISLRCLKTCTSCPYFVIVDEEENYFKWPTRYNVSPEKTSLYILDCLFSVYVVGTLVVFVWRGSWILLDTFILPDDEIRSYWCSLIIGYGGAIVAYLMQPIMRWICDRLEGAARVLAADVFLLFCFIFTVNMWRGIWNLLNVYFLPDNMELSCWITHWVCLILLILLKCSNSLLVRGVYIDAEEPGGKCAIFPIYYLRVIFQNERTKKKKKIQSDIINMYNEHVKQNSTNLNHVTVNVNSDNLKPNDKTVP